jgi:hypothetical protein
MPSPAAVSEDAAAAGILFLKKFFNDSCAIVLSKVKLDKTNMRLPAVSLSASLPLASIPDKPD